MKKGTKSELKAESQCSKKVATQLAKKTQNFIMSRPIPCKSITLHRKLLVLCACKLFVKLSLSYSVNGKDVYLLEVKSVCSLQEEFK